MKNRPSDGVSEAQSFDADGGDEAGGSVVSFITRFESASARAMSHVAEGSGPVGGGSSEEAFTARPVTLDLDIAPLEDEGEDHHLEEDLIEEDVSEMVDRRSMSGEELEAYVADIVETVKIGLEQSISILTPWFFKNMPDIYYQTTPRAEKIRHLSAVITGHIFETKQTVDLWSRDRSKVTFIGPGGQAQIVSAMARKISALDIKMGSIYFSKDKLLFLSTFHFRGYVPLDFNNRHISLKLSLTRKMLNAKYPDQGQSVDRFLENLDNDFVTSSTETRIQLTYRMVRHMENHEGAHTFFDRRENAPKRGRLTIGVKDVGIAEIFEAVLALIQRHYKILRSFSVRLEKGYENSIVVMHFEIQNIARKKIEHDSYELVVLTKALRTLGWVDNDLYTQFMQVPFSFSINAANLMRAMAVWTHVQLSKKNAYYYSEHKIFHTMSTHVGITEDILKLFRTRFDHSAHNRQRLEEVSYDEQKQQLLEKIQAIFDHVCRDIFLSCVYFIHYTLKTNYFLPTKTGLSFRLDPEILDAEYYPAKPFGIFFVIGRDYRFFQVRWKDISRGGMRIIMPQKKSEYSHELSSLFDEVFDLSFAQQMKNKDIPEGGSKAVALVKPGGDKDRVVRGAVNALLDLLVECDESLESQSSELLKYYTQDEIIYLGPDENMTNELISWIANQASRRGYRYGRAFMSSKPGDGINHKEYGVTSEGLNVYLEQALLHLGIDPRQHDFTVKMTGGPSGDVAGNELKILHREYGERAKLVVIADGSGAASDPQGLDWQELLRLVREGKDIVHFDPEKLSSAGEDAEAFVIDTSSREKLRQRDRCYIACDADVFIPAGGRPYTITEKNYQGFLKDDGGTTCRVVIEGANIFFTPAARNRLEEAGVLIIKDSSANKAGVICSSYETVGSLIFSSEEFCALKDRYVAEVITRLRDKAREEAQLLLRETKERSKHRGERVGLSELSVKISEQINTIKDMLLEDMASRGEEYLENKNFQEILKSYVPAVVLKEHPDSLSRLPPSYQFAIVATVIASRIVYREGVDWLSTLPPSMQTQACLAYFRNEKIKFNLIESVQSSDLEHKDKICTIIEHYAARELTLSELRQSSEEGSFTPSEVDPDITS